MDMEGARKERERRDDVKGGKERKEETKVETKDTIR